MTDISSKITFYLLAFLLLFAPLARGAVQGWAIGVIFMTVLASLSIYLAVGVWQWNLRWIPTPLDLPILALVCLMFFSSLFSVHHSTSMLANVQLLNCIAVYYLVVYTIRTRDTQKKLVYWILGISVFLSLFGLIKSGGMNPFPWWNYEHQKNSYFVTATFGNHNHLAGWLEMSLPLLLGILFLRRRKTANRYVLYTFLLLLGVAIVFSQSRGGWLAMLMGILFMGVWFYRKGKILSRGWAMALLAVVVSGSFLVVVSTPTTERVLTAKAGLEEGGLASRITAWQGTVDQIKGKPLLGSGPGTFNLSFPKYQPSGQQVRFVHAHNDYLDFIAELGFGLLVIIIWMVVALYRHGLEKLKSKSSLTRSITLGGLAGITAILVHSMVDFNLHIPANAILFAVLAALVASPMAERIERQF